MDKQLVTEIGRKDSDDKSEKNEDADEDEVGHFLNFLQKYHNFIFSY